LEAAAAKKRIASNQLQDGIVFQIKKTIHYMKRKVTYLYIDKSLLYILPGLAESNAKSKTT